MHSVKLEPAELILRGTRTTYEATGNVVYESTSKLLYTHILSFLSRAYVMRPLSTCSYCLPYNIHVW